MALPGGAAGFQLSGGTYDDPSFQGMAGKLTLSAPVTHVATGERIRRTWDFSIDYSGNFSIGTLPFTDDPAFSPVGWTYTMEWQAISWKDTPGNLTFSVPRGSDTAGVVDFDKLIPATSGGVSIPFVHGVPAGGTSGQVLSKASSTDYDLTWTAQTGGSGGGAVASVNAKTGTVVLSASDVGADAAGAATAAQTAAVAAAATDATTKANAAQAAAVQRANHTGTQSADTLTDGTTNKAFLATERTKLAGVATGATAVTVAAAGTAGAALSATDATTTNARTPTAHASSHASGGSDPITTSLVADSTILTNLVPQRQRSSRIAFFGDSITGYLYKYPVLAQALSLGRIQVTGLYSHAGLASAALVPFVTDFTTATPKPGKVVILCGTNDAQGTVTAGAFRANLLAIAQAALNVGIEPVLCTIPPLGSQFTEAKRGNVAAINAQVKILAASLNLQVIDFHAVTADPANGQYLATYDSGDGIHPAYPAQLVMAQTTVSTLQPSTPPGGLPLVDFNTDASNLFTNPLALTDGNADGIPDGWDAFNTATGLAYSLVTDAAIKGKWATITATASSAQSQIQNRRVGGFSAGDTCYFAALVKTSGLNSAGGFAVYVNWWVDYGGTIVRGDNIGSGGPVSSGPGLYAATLVAPAGATQVSLQMTPAASTGVYQLGQVTGYNLTALGIS